MAARSEVPSSFRSSSVRPGPLALVRLGITETLSRRRLIAYLVRADLRRKGADTLLGNVWWVIDPLLQMLVYWLLVGVILQRGNVDAFPLFIFAAILPWKWFDSSIRDGISSVVSQERLIKQIYFPKLVLPVASAMSGIANFSFGLIPLLAMMLVLYSNRLTPWVLLVPVVAAVQLLFSMGIVIFVSGINVFYRDIGNLSRHVLRFWFYLSPALYGVDQLESITAKHPTIGIWFQLNPWTYFFNSYRDLIYYHRAPEWQGLAVIAVISLLVIAVAVWFFKRLEPGFAKVL